ncbi:LysR family transcriptional regulator [Marinobacterium jannaschii]|uniref:LysR family transcriptional regulator n=1 Tax=Marinobacterium jannaschii TaxID=64970 RepID=UPI00047F68B9|nr:LysR family transcriptional regulator [Marinobacterium jannaschii]
MNINHMRAFLEVAKSGSFQLAAERLHITQSTVSSRIKVLETQLGSSLLIRKRDGSELTSAGRHFIRFAHTAVRAWEQARQEVGLPDELKSVISLGVQLNLWDRMAPPWIDRMQHKLPEIGTRVMMDYSENLLEAMSNGELDLAITFVPRQQAELVSEFLMEDTLVLVSTEPRKAVKHWMPDYVFVDWGAEFRAAHAQAYPETRAPKLSVGLGMVGLDYILRYGGCGYFPERSIESLINQGKLFYIEDAPKFQRPVYMAYPKEPVDMELLEIAIETLREVVSDDMSTNQNVS